MIHLKKIITKFNKCIKYKNERKYKKLKINILKNITSSVLKNIKNY